MKNFSKYFQAILILYLIASCSYLPELPQIDETDVVISEDEDKIQIEPVDSAHQLALMFVPGGLVDPHAYKDTYIPLARDHNMLIVILKVRGNLSILNPKAIKRVKKEYSGHEWLLGGHSLGGVSASGEIAKNPDDWKMLFLQGSYSSTSDLSSYPGMVLSLRGSNDGLTSQEDWEKYSDKLPAGKYYTDINAIDTGSSLSKTIYFTILGGNHGQWGDYGPQAKDGEAQISGQAQKEIFRSVLLKILRQNGYDI